jgi:hypothetical protein
MSKQADRLAWGIANAVDRYFRSGAAGPTPSPYPSFTPSTTPSPSRTSTRTVTPSSTPLLSVGGTPGTPVRGQMLTRTAQAVQPPPTATPLTGTITSDGRWLPPLAPNGRRLPPPGSNEPEVYLGESDDDPGPDAQINVPGWQPHIWRQYYVPRLGRSIWTMGPVFVRTPTPVPTPSPLPSPSVTAGP